MRFRFLLSVIVAAFILGGPAITVIYASTNNGGFVFTPEPQHVINTVRAVRSDQTWSVYMPTELLKSDTFERATGAITLDYKDSTWVESTVPFPINKSKAVSVRLIEDPHALWAPLAHGGEVEFRIYRTYVLVKSATLTKSQLIYVTNSESPAGG